MKNGDLCQPVKIRGETVLVRNTCAFDAIIIIVAYIIGINTEYKNIVQATDDSFLQLAIKIACRGKLTKYEYTERASFLINLPLLQQTSYTRRFNSLDAMCNAALLAEYIFLPLPSVDRNKICTNCHYTNEKKFAVISVNVDILLNKGLQYVQDAINDTSVLKQTCVKCKNSCEIIEKYDPQIIIDTSILTDPNYLKNIGLEPKS